MKIDSATSTCIILAPGKYPAPAVIVYGGKDLPVFGRTGGQWLSTQIPSGLKGRVVFVLPKDFSQKKPPVKCFEIELTACLKELWNNISPTKINSYSLCGYSRGGERVYKYFSGPVDWKILGLIDPVTPPDENLLDGVKSKIRCVYSMENWGGAGGNPGGAIWTFHEHLLEQKVNMVTCDGKARVQHRDMPAKFFNTYGSDLIP